MKDLFWDLFATTGKIEYYVKYREAVRREVSGKRYNRGENI